MAAPTKATNNFPSCIAVPSLTANNFAIATSGAGYGILEMKTALLAKTGALHFDAIDDGADYVAHTITTEPVEGVNYNNGHKERLMSINIVCENNNLATEAGDTARGALNAMHGNTYDFYCYDDLARTSGFVRKLVGVVVSMQKGETPGEKPVVTITGQTKAEANATSNYLKTTFPAA